MSLSEPLRYQRIVPLLQVNSMSDTLEYYQQVLGFALDFLWPSEVPAREAIWAAVSRDGAGFMFTMDLGTSSSPFIAEKGNGVVFYLIVADVAALYHELVERGALVVQDLHDFAGRLQFSVADPNGYMLAFSQPFT